MRSAALILSLLAPPALADTAAVPKGDVTGFEACFIQMMLDNSDNPMVELMGPALCGERTIPMTQTCESVDYMLFDRRATCKAGDLAFWQAQVETRAAAAVADGRSGVGSLHENGLAQCTEVAASGDDPLDCLIEINWRTSMEFLAADLVASLIGASE